MFSQAGTGSTRRNSKPPVRDVRHLGDFTASPRLLFIAALALPVGAVSAVVSWALLRLIGIITNAVFFGRWSTAQVTVSASTRSPLVILLAPIAGGLVIGLLARFGSEKIRGHGMPEAIEAILLGESKVAPRVALLKPVSAAIAIGTGGPFGAEGPIIMTGGAFGSLLAQHIRLTADERKTLLVAGAAAGMAATFNSPFASVLLALELLLFEWRPRSLVPVTVAVSVSTILRAPLLGRGALFPMPAPLHISVAAEGLAVVSGLLSGLLAIIATGLVYAAEDAFHRLPIHWMWWPAIGGAIIGIGGLIRPEALGVGYNVIASELNGSIGLRLVVGLLIVKTLIWSLSLGSGTSGGVLAPMFMLGGAIGALESHAFPVVGPGFWALVGLAGVLGGVMRSPLTGVVFALELTRHFEAVLPLLIAATAAYTTSVLLLKRSVLTEKLARRGYHLSREYDVDPLALSFVEDVMERDVMTFTAETSVGRALHAISDNAPASLANRRQMLYPVLDDAGELTAVITRTQLETALHQGQIDVAVGTLGMTEPIVTHPDQTLRAVAEAMASNNVNRLPVVARDDDRQLLGIVTLTHLLAARLRDLREAEEADRVLSISRPPWSTKSAESYSVVANPNGV